jgi:cob(I)alamin adenosyltransferase
VVRQARGLAARSQQQAIHRETSVGHRLSKIYTRTGDGGSTGLADGSRVDKDDVRVEAMGAVDELNSNVGVILAHVIPTEMRECLTDVQHALFDIGGELAIPGSSTVTADYVTSLEKALDEVNAALPPLKEFILPGGGAAAAAVHVARSVCRRAERRLFSLSRRDDVNPHSRAYLNRLSDLFFVLARSLARAHGNEVYWDPRRNRG